MVIDPEQDRAASRRFRDPTDGGGSSSSQTQDQSDVSTTRENDSQSQRPDMENNATNPVDIPNVDQIVEDRVDMVEEQFRSELADTRNQFNKQIDAVSGSVSDLNSNVQESFSALGSGLENTQNAVASIPGSIANLVNGQNEEEGSGGGESGISTETLVAGAAAALAVAYGLTQ